MRIATKQSEIWSIGLYKMLWKNNRFNFLEPKEIRNPILTAGDIKDRKAEFVADPFLIYEKGIYYIFFEVCGNSKENIGLAISKDGYEWEYQKIVLDEPFNVAYPCIFRWSDKYYMTPETYKTNSVRLYKAVEFPFKWKFVKTLVERKDFADPTILLHENKLWLFVSEATSVNLYLYYADTLEGTWEEHPMSPVIKNDPTKARPGGNAISIDNRLIRIAQNDYPYYGNSIRAFEIIKLNHGDYEECELKDSPLLAASGTGWNKDGMHQLSTYKINENEFLACVDGKRHKKKYYLKIG